jgi:hypothetical protein
LQHGCLGHTHDNKPGAQPAGEPGGKRMHVCTCTSQDHPPNTTRYDQEPGHLHTKQLCCCMQSQAVLRQACPFDCTCHRRSMRLCPKRLFSKQVHCCNPLNCCHQVHSDDSCDKAGTWCQPACLAVPTTQLHHMVRNLTCLQ